MLHSFNNCLNRTQKEHFIREENNEKTKHEKLIGQLKFVHSTCISCLTYCVYCVYSLVISCIYILKVNIDLDRNLTIFITSLFTF